MDRMMNERDASKRYDLVEKKERSNLYLFAAGKAVSLFGTHIYSFATSLYILKLTGSGTNFALSILLGALPRVIFGPISGFLADRTNRKKMIVGLDFLSGAVLLVLLTISMFYGLRLPFIYGTTFLLAVISTFFNTTFSAAIPSLVSDQKLVKINSYSRAIDSGAQILGPVLGGVIFGFVSMKFFLLMNGISFVLSAISEIFIDFDFNKSNPPEEETADKSKSIRANLGEVFAFIRQTPLLALIMPISVSINFLMAASLSVVLPFLLNQTLGFTSSQYGIVEGAFSLGMLIAALIVGRLPEKPKKRKGLIISMIGMGLSMIAMGIPGLTSLSRLPRLFLLITYIILAVCFALMLLLVDLPMTVVTQRLIPDHMRGRVMGIWSSISTCFSPLGIILAGLTLELIPAYMVFFAAGIYFIAVPIFLARHRTLRDY